MGGKSRIMAEPSYHEAQTPSDLDLNTLQPRRVSAGSPMLSSLNAWAAQNRPYPEPHYGDPLSSDLSRMRMIGMRMRLPEGGSFPFQHISTALGDEKVFVFIVQDNTAVIIEDDRYLFPSDTLVAQLRLIQK